MFKRSPVVNLLTVLIPEKFQSFEILSIDHVYDKITTQVILPCRPPSKSDEIYAKLLADALPCLQNVVFGVVLLMISIFKK